jgi:serine/threonine-protein phosphatase 2B catalytic subunit
MIAFDCLPVAALVTNRQGSFFCTHGGLSPDIVQLDDIEDFDRFMEPPEGGALCDLLWSDPIEECTALGLSEEDMEEWYDIDYVPNPTRGCGYIFGYAAVAPFLESNNLLCLVRAHEVQKEGYHCHYYWKRDLDFPLTITVFSAPNYCDMYGNQGGYIKFEENDFDFGQVGWVEHPYYLPNFMNAITYSLPYALEGFTKLCVYILEGCMADDDAELEETDEEIRQKVESFGKMSVLIRRIRERRSDIIAGTVSLGDEISKFEKAIRFDGRNEHRPALAVSAAVPVPVEQPKRRRTRTIS